MKTGLIPEGGAMRGLFSAGVMDVLMERGIAFDGAIGVSAGAAFGCDYKSRHLRYNETLADIREREASGAALAIRPPALLEIGWVEHDAGRMRQVYHCGRAAAEQHLKKIQSFLA